MPGPIRKAVFPVAGRGTRFLPATKASPKEMLPVVDKPLVQYAVEEAVAAGARDLIFITGRTKRAIEDHFDHDHELERELRHKGKDELLEMLYSIVPDGVNCIFIRQPAPLGLGHAVLCARPAVGDEPFFVVLPDDLIRSEVPCLAQMMEVYGRHRGSVVAVQHVPEDQTHRYGIVEADPVEERVYRMRAMVEKPSPGTAPSDMAVIGRYLLSPKVFDRLERTQRGTGGEIQLTDALAELLKVEATHAYAFEGTRFDCGDKLGYMEAMVRFGLDHPELGPGLRRYLDSL